MYYTGSKHEESGSAIRIFNSNNIIVENCTFDNTRSKQTVGGAILVNIANYITIRNCGFSNIHSGSSGGAIDFYPLSEYTHSNLIENCNFYDCSGGNGGAIELYTKSSTVKNCTFELCQAGFSDVSSGGGIVLYDGCDDNKILDCIFKYCTGAIGGAICVNNANSRNLNVSNCLFINNTAEITGGAIHVSSANPVIFNSTFINNSASEGGAVRFSANNGQMINCTYINNTATVDGGGLCSQATGSVFDGCSFSGNNASKGPDFYGHGMPITFRNMFFTSLWLTNSNYTTTDSYNHTLSYGFGTSWDQPARWDENVTAYLKKNTHCTIY